MPSLSVQRKILTRIITDQLCQRDLYVMLFRNGSIGLKKKTPFSSFQRATSTQKKKPAKRKLTLWECVFGRKRASENPRACQLANCQEQTRCKENARYQVMPGNVLVSINPIKSSKYSRRLVELQPKPPPLYKLPRAVLLSKVMIEGFPEEDSCEDKMVIPTTPKKPYEEMKPASTINRIIECRKNVRLEDIKSYENSTSRLSIPISSAKARDSTAKILRQAMTQEEPRMHSRTEQLKILVNDKKAKPQCASRVDPESKNSNDK